MRQEVRGKSREAEGDRPAVTTAFRLQRIALIKMLRRLWFFSRGSYRNCRGLSALKKSCPLYRRIRSYSQISANPVALQGYHRHLYLRGCTLGAHNALDDNKWNGRHDNVVVGPAESGSTRSFARRDKKNTGSFWKIVLWCEIYERKKILGNICFISYLNKKLVHILWIAWIDDSLNITELYVYFCNII